LRASASAKFARTTATIILMRWRIANYMALITLREVIGNL